MGTHVIPRLDSVTIAGLLSGSSMSSDPMAAAIADGARVRAIVDLCERLEIAAFLVQRTGNVLIMTRTTASVLGGGLVLREGRLEGDTNASRRMIDRVVDRALSASGRKQALRAVIPSATMGPLFVVAYTYPDTSTSQLVKAVVVVGRDRDVLNGKLPQLVEALNTL